MDSAAAFWGPGGSEGPRERRTAPSPLPPARLLSFPPSKLAGRDWPQRRRAAGRVALARPRRPQAAESGPYLGRERLRLLERSLSDTARPAAAHRHWGRRALSLCTWHAQGPPPSAPSSLRRELPPGTRPPDSERGGHSGLFKACWREKGDRRQKSELLASSLGAWGFG